MSTDPHKTVIEGLLQSVGELNKRVEALERSRPDYRLVGETYEELQTEGLRWREKAQLAEANLEDVVTERDEWKASAEKWEKLARSCSIERSQQQARAQEGEMRAEKAEALASERGACLDEAEDKISDLLEWRRDVEESHAIVMEESCPTDERHCTCVPVLRGEVGKLKERAEKAEALCREAFDCWQKNNPLSINQMLRLAPEWGAMLERLRAAGEGEGDNG